MGLDFETAAVPILAVALGLAAATRDNFSPSSVVLDFLVKHESRSVTLLLVENFAVWLTVFGTAHVLLYGLKPGRAHFQKTKFNPAYPPRRLVFAEMLRSARGLVICTAYDLLINWMAAHGQLPIKNSPFGSIFSPNGGQDNPLEITGAVLLLYVWGDMHFYWTHRLLHTRWLFKSVHKVHHESHNPDPFSGLSMHPVESLIYFSAAPLLAPFVPLWLFRMMKLGLIVFPLPGHSGHGSWDSAPQVHHYIHHAKFNWNYGSSPLWDYFCDTTYDANKLMGDQQKSATKLAEEQARLCGCVLENMIGAPDVE